MFATKLLFRSRTLQFLGLGLLLFVFLPQPLLAQGDWVVFFQDDFEDGNADGWNFHHLYGDAEFHVEDEGGKFVLSGSGHGHADPIVDGWANYSFKSEVKFIEGDGGVHFNYRINNGRYFLGFSPDGISLSKEKPDGIFNEIVSLNEQHDYGKWYNVEIVGVENNIKVYVDGINKIDYIDIDPVDWGTFGLETLDDSHIHFDNIIVRGEKPPTFDLKWIRTGGPSGGLGYDVRIHPLDKNIMFVTDNPSGVNKSYDGGDTWVQRNEGIINTGTAAGPSGDGIPIFSLTIDPRNPDIVWAGTQEARGIYVSIDEGETWMKKDNGVIEGNDISFRNFGVHPYNSNIVFAGAEISTGILGIAFDKTKGKIYKTEDGGENWRTVWECDNLVRFVLFNPSNPDIMYASTGIFDREAFNNEGVGILKSTDGGETWFQINNGIPNSEGNWFVGFLEMHPTNPQILFAASGNNAMGPGGVFRTTNGGANWEKVLSDDEFTVVTISPSNPNIIYAGSQYAFYRSDDGGSNWNRYNNQNEGYWGPPGIRAGFPISAVVDPFDPMTVFANNYTGGNFKSTDGGRTWVNSSNGYTGADLVDIAIDADNPATVYTIGRSGPFRSHDGGYNWTGLAFSPANFPGWNTVTLNPSDPKEVFIADGGMAELLKSSDGGNSWTEVFRHPNAEEGTYNNHGFKSIMYAPSNPSIIYAGMSKDRRTIDGGLPPKPSFGMYKSTDTGETWFEINTGLGTPLININTIAVHPTNPNIVYIGTWRDGVFKTTNGGESWNLKSNGLASSDVRSLAIDPQNPNVVYAGLGEGAGVFKSTNGGDLWGEINNGLRIECPQYLLPIGKVNIGVSLEEIPRRRIATEYYSVPWTSVRSIVIDPTNSQTIYASDYHSGVYMSPDGGDTWYAANNMLTTRAVSALAVSADGRVLYAATSGGGIFRLVVENYTPEILSTFPDSDRTVSIVQGDSVRFEVIAYDLNADSLSYFWILDNILIDGETSPTYLLRTTDLLLGYHSLRAEIADADTSVNVTWDIEIETPTRVDDEKLPNLPKTFALLQNYPNPFNAETVIKYQLPKTATVVIKIYNLLGQEIKMLVNEQKDAGYFTINWDGKNRNGIRVASGIYLYRIDTISEKQQFIHTKKMVLLQ